MPSSRTSIRNTSDYYGTRDVLLDAFVAFANSVSGTGACLLGVDHPGVTEIMPRITSRKILFGFAPEADVQAESVKAISGGQRCRVRLPSEERFEFDLMMPGRHNVLNALAAIAIGLEHGVGTDQLAKALATFPGVARRFERKGHAAGFEIVDDYAHHPAELAANAGRRAQHSPGPSPPSSNPIVFTRTRDCWDEFLSAFEAADRVVICDIYPASEFPIDGISARPWRRRSAERGIPTPLRRKPR